MGWTPSVPVCKEIMTAEERKDFLWILVVSVLILLWSSIPNWAGYRAETAQLRFRGLSYDSQDYAVHLAMMAAGAHGDWGYQLRFTTESHSAAYIRLFYIALGHISGWLRIPSASMFEMARWMFGLLALFTLYQLMRQCFSDLYWARIGFLIAALGSGLGWFQLLLGWLPQTITPIDFWLIDDYVFFGLSVFPHFAFVTAAMCWVLLLWLRFLDVPDWRNILMLIAVIVTVQFVNPIAFAAVDLGLLGAVLFSWWRVKKVQMHGIIALIFVALAQLPLLLYNVWILSKDPLWSEFTAQNQTLSPPPVYYLWGFALFWPLALLGAISIYRKQAPMLGATLLWILSAFLLAYSPYYIQRRFLQNIAIPLGILATFGLKFLVDAVSKKLTGRVSWQPIFVSVFLVLISMSTIQLSLGRAVYLQTHPKEFYYPSSLDSAITWFREHAEYNDFVLASKGTSQVLAQKAGMRVYSGHEMETLNYKVKEVEVTAFYQGQFSSLARHPIKWVVYGPEEKSINPNFIAPGHLELEYETSELKIYQVK
jgi:hypothetical protein